MESEDMRHSSCSARVGKKNDHPKQCMPPKDTVSTAVITPHHKPSALPTFPAWNGGTAFLDFPLRARSDHPMLKELITIHPSGRNTAHPTPRLIMCQTPRLFVTLEVGLPASRTARSIGCNTFSTNENA